jgi:hypothetical protein
VEGQENEWIRHEHVQGDRLVQGVKQKTSQQMKRSKRIYENKCTSSVKKVLNNDSVSATE